MHKLATLLVAGAFGLGLGAPAFADENESGHEHQSVKMEELPAAVQATFEHQAKGGQIEELRKETRKDGAAVYEGEIVKNGKGRDLEVSSTGKVLERGKATTRAANTRRSESVSGQGPRVGSSLTSMIQVIHT
jgi:hypothetical protein